MLDRHALTALTQAVTRGDGAAFRSLYDDRAAAVYGVALRITGDADGAAEAVQHTFVEAWRNLKGDGTRWDAPDLELLRICRNHASQIVNRHGQGPDAAAQTAVAEPVRDGTASFELLSLLQMLGRMSDECRDALTSVWYDCLTAEGLAAHLALTQEQTLACIRRCYAEIRDASPPSDPVKDREADLLAMRQALGLSQRTETADAAAVEDWERNFAPFGELVQPVPPPADAFDAIMARVNALNSVETVAETGRKAEIWRAALFVGIAAAAALLIYFGLVAIGDDAGTLPNQ